MTIKEGTRLAETGILGDDLNIARALSLDTVDEFYDFITLFPADAASLFSSTDLADISRQIVPMSTVSMMAAHAHRDLRMQPAFPARFPPGVVKDPVPAAENAIWDQLLETWILLRRRPVHERVVRRIHQFRHRGIEPRL